MTFSSKAIFTALILSIAPVAASAQSGLQLDFGQIGAPGVGGTILPIDLSLVPTVGGPRVIGTPTPSQAQDCGAARYQGLVGQHVSVPQSMGVAARYFTPDSPYGTMDYLPYRLNISANASYTIDRVYCG